MNIHENLEEFMVEYALNPSAVARGVGVSQSMISQYRKQSYKGDIKKLEKKLGMYMANFNPYVEIENIEVHQTRNLIISHDILKQVQSTRSTAIIYGTPGSGKTVMVKEFSKNHPEAIVVYTSCNITTKNILEEMCEKVGVSKGTPYQMSENLKRYFMLSKKSNHVIIIDEAENMKTSALETIRNIRDESGVPIVYVGTHALLSNLQGRGGELKQLSSRVFRQWEFQPLEKDEWTQVFGEVGAYIRTLTNNFRVAREAIYDTALTYANSLDEELQVRHIDAVLPTVFIPR